MVKIGLVEKERFVWRRREKNMFNGKSDDRKEYEFAHLRYLVTGKWKRGFMAWNVKQILRRGVLPASHT